MCNNEESELEIKEFILFTLYLRMERLKWNIKGEKATPVQA